LSVAVGRDRDLRRAGEVRDLALPGVVAGKTSHFAAIKLWHSGLERLLDSTLDRDPA
jgi:hypothetical protein